MKPIIGPKLVAPPREPNIEVAGHSVAANIVTDIHTASKKTGASFRFLMAQAAKESGFANEAKSRQSSAAGMFQFTRQTWLQMIKEHGVEHGLEQFSGAITKSPSGEYTVSDPAMRKTILDLRRDPAISAVMAAEYAKENETYLQRRLGRKVGDTDLYMAHFLGPAGAAKLLKARDEGGTVDAAELLPKAAKANPSIFYEAKSPRSVAAVYDKINHAIEKPGAQYAKLEGIMTKATAMPRTEVALGPTILYPPSELGLPDEAPAILMAEAEIIPEGSGSRGDSLAISQPMPARGESSGRDPAPAVELIRNWARGLLG